jgi:hypothetical protein
VFGDAARGEIVVIYLPTKAFSTPPPFAVEKEVRSGFCMVTNFSYTNKNFDLLSGLARDIIVHHAPRIKDEILKAANANNEKVI